jgi:malic enzyme
VSENTTSNNSVCTPAEPAVPNDPLRNRGVAFTLADVSAPGASPLPAVENLRASSATTATAVAQAAADDGVATRKSDDLVQAVQDAIWQPAYPDLLS